MMYKNGRVSIECFVCWVNLFIFIVGVLVFLKNYFLVWLVEKNLLNKMKENEFIREVLKRSEENMGGLKNVIYEMYVCWNLIKK